MPTVTRYPTTETVISGTWSTPSQVRAADGVVASTTLASVNTTAEFEQGGYGFGAVLPPGATINGVTLETNHRVSTPDGTAVLESYVRIYGTSEVINSDSTEPLTLTARSYPVGRPGGGTWLVDDLADGVFTTRLRARRDQDPIDIRVTQADDTRITEVGDTRITSESATGAATVQFDWDYVRVVVDYTDTRLLVDLMQGAVLVASRVLTGLTTTPTDFAFVLTADELARITDADALTVIVTSGTSGQQVTAARLELAGTPTVQVDTTAPAIVNLSPAAGATNVATSSNIVVTFNDEIRRGSGTLVLRTASGQVMELFPAATSTRLTLSGSTLTIDPTPTLAFDTQYFLDIPAGAITDDAGNAFPGLLSYSFTTTPDLTGPVVVSYDPAVNATGVALGVVFTLTFNTAMQRGTGTIVLRTEAGTPVESFHAATSPRLTITGNTVVLDPTLDLTPNYVYYLDIPAGALRSQAGVSFAGTTQYRFAAVTQSVNVVSYSPAFGATDIALASNVVLTFNVPVQRGVGTIALYAAPSTLVETFNVATSPRVTVAGTIVTIDPTAVLDYSRVYTVVIPPGAITDLVGNAFAGTTTYTFTTVTTSGTGAPAMPSIPSQGFKVALAKADHTRSAVEVTLYPAPSKVEYPNAPLGEMIETADGRVVMQQPTKDPRRRSWIWTNYGPMIQTYERQFRWLEGLRSRYRQMGGQSPYIYVYDGTTNLLNKRQNLTTNLVSRSGRVLTVADYSATVNPGTLVNGTVDLYVNGATSAEQRCSIVAATATTITVDQDIGVSGTIVCKVGWLEPSWWRVRVLDTTRTPLEAGNLRYAESKFAFVIEDPTWTEVG